MVLKLPLDSGAHLALMNCTVLRGVNIIIGLDCLALIALVYKYYIHNIVDIEILEEFAYLRTDQGGNVRLDIQTNSLPK